MSLRKADQKENLLNGPKQTRQFSVRGIKALFVSTDSQMYLKKKSDASSCKKCNKLNICQDIWFTTLIKVRYLKTLKNTITLRSLKRASPYNTVITEPSSICIKLILKKKDSIIIVIIVVLNIYVYERGSRL